MNNNQFSFEKLWNSMKNEKKQYYWSHLRNNFVFLNSPKFDELNLYEKKIWFSRAVKDIRVSQTVHFSFFSSVFNDYFQEVQETIEILQFDSILGSFVLELRCGSESQEPSAFLAFIQQKLFYYQECNKICNDLNDFTENFNTFQKLNHKTLTLQKNFFQIFKKKYIQSLIEYFEKRKIRPPVRNSSLVSVIPEYYRGLEENILEQVVFIDEQFFNTINKEFSHYPTILVSFTLHQSIVNEAKELITYWSNQLILSIEIGYYNFESFDFYYFKKNNS